MSALYQGRSCLLVVERVRADLERGALVTVEPGRVRVRLPDEETR